MPNTGTQRDDSVNLSRLIDYTNNNLDLSPDKSAQNPTERLFLSKERLPLRLKAIHNKDYSVVKTFKAGLFGVSLFLGYKWGIGDFR